MESDAVIFTMCIGLLIRGDRDMRGIDSSRGIQFQMNPQQRQMWLAGQHKLKRASPKEIFEKVSANWKCGKGKLFCIQGKLLGMI